MCFLKHYCFIKVLSIFSLLINIGLFPCLSIFFIYNIIASINIVLIFYFLFFIFLSNSFFLLILSFYIRLYFSRSNFFSFYFLLLNAYTSATFQTFCSISLYPTKEHKISTYKSISLKETMLIRLKNY